MAEYQIIGGEKIHKMFGQLQNLANVLDPVYGKVARQALRQLIIDTPKMTGQTARGWLSPLKRGPSNYVIENKTSTTDGKKSLVEILDKGRGPVYPKNARKLYIPLSNRGRSKKLGAAIPAGFVYGKDYVLANKAGPARGKFFIKKINDDVSEKLETASIKELERLGIV